MRPALALALLLLSIPVNSHELRPAYLQIEQTGEQQFAVSWRVPARGELRLSLNVDFDQSVTLASPQIGRIANGFYTETFTIRHANALAGAAIGIDGLQQTMTDALVRISWRDGREQLVRLLPDRPQFTVQQKAGSGQIAATYFALGLEHILLGIDHLLFVLALVLLVSGWRQLLGTITAFTLAHSLTLAAAVLGWMSVPQAPVEAVIALSILFVASEILRKRRGHISLATRRPWLVAFGFGLLHGLGFAGALAEIGVPAHAIPLALALFNIGVEAGQLVFIAVALSMFALLRRLPLMAQWQVGNSGTAALPHSAVPLAYLIGGLAAWWLMERTLPILS